MRRIEYIIIHSSDSAWGNAGLINSWHKERGFKNGSYHIGYHKVILNGRTTYGSPYNVKLDGIIENGRPDELEGAHVYGLNHSSLGVCLIGKADDVNYPTQNQISSLISICKEWMNKYNITVEKILGHREAQIMLKNTNLKICPGFDVSIVRNMLQKDNVPPQVIKSEKERLAKIKELALEIISRC